MGGVSSLRRRLGEFHLDIGNLAADRTVEHPDKGTYGFLSPGVHGELDDDLAHDERVFIRVGSQRGSHRLNNPVDNYDGHFVPSLFFFVKCWLWITVARYNPPALRHLFP